MMRKKRSQKSKYDQIARQMRKCDDASEKYLDELIRAAKLIEDLDDPEDSDLSGSQPPSGQDPEKP